MQSGSLTPVSSPAGSFSTLVGSRSPPATPKLPASVAQHSPASSLSLPGTTRSSVNRSHGLADGSSNMQSPFSDAHRAQTPSNHSLESTSSLLYSAERNSLLGTQNPSVESVSDEVASQIGSNGLGLAFSVSSSSESDGNRFLKPPYRPLRSFPRPQSIDRYRPSMLRNVDNASIPDTGEVSDAPEPEGAMKATYKLMSSLGLRDYKYEKVSDIKDSDSSASRASSLYGDHTTVTSREPTTPTGLQMTKLNETRTGDTLEITDVGALHWRGSSNGVDGGNTNRAYHESLHTSSEDTEIDLEDSHMASGLSGNTASTTSVFSRASTFGHEPLATENFSMLPETGPSTQSLEGPISSTTQPPDDITLGSGEERESGVRENRKRDTNLHDSYQGQIEEDTAPSPSLSSTSSTQKSSSSRSQASHPTASSIARVVRNPFSLAPQASRSTSSLSSIPSTPGSGHGKARPSPRTRGLLAGMRAEVASIVHGKGKRKSRS